MNCRRAFLLAGLGLGLMPAAVRAHHGWNWTTGENIELTGVITEAELGNPHGVVKLRTEDAVWTVEVGQPWRNDRAGLARDALAKGVTLTVIGEPSADRNEKLIKAERLRIDGRTYELYPDRD